MAAEKISLKFNEDDLTIGDLEDFEDAAGESITKALSPKPVLDDNGDRVKDEKGRPVSEVQMSAKALKTLVWIILRADRPGFSLADARNIRVTSLEMAGDDDDLGKDDGTTS